MYGNGHGNIITGCYHSCSIDKYPDEESLLAIYYGEKDCVLDEGGIILFDPASQRNVVGAEKFSYND